ncbi:PAS domain-containing sensor histidine kinase [Luteitalea sp. TBR-22]|uniref:hybrid sensor histidine kinase/response regulator n=1 Tax=Luteitalea sp. TBR-22 TaxID=2802971 RepID=UPI001EF5DEDF|nr:PAS domain-containing sensor histidine kinase [Luteitalea sp. TBR-22]
MSGNPENADLHALGLYTLVDVLESLPDACTLSRAVRDADGRAVDMTLVWMNRQARAGQPAPEAALGRCCTELWPQMVENGSFGACMRVLDSGQAERGEFDWTERTTYAGGYYDWAATRVGDDLLLWVLRDASDRFRRTLESEARLTGILAAAPDAVIVIGEDGRITLANDACEALLGWTPTELAGEAIEILMPEPEAREHAGWLHRYSETGEPHVIGTSRDVIARHRDGRAIAVRLSVSETTLFGRRVFTGMLHDLRTRQQLEAQLRHAQKMEVVGRLVASVSHDFNNVLTIMTAASALLEPLVTAPPARDLVREIVEATQRGTALTQQLLALARPREAAIEDVDPAAIVGRLEASMRRLVGRDVAVQLDLAAEGESIRADVPALEQALLNLVVNARDAMPDGGTLTLSTRVAEGGVEGAPDEGRWMALMVQDTGTGMTPEVIARACEPFFTTKPEGRGTGLGLSSVRDLVDRLDGRMTIDSVPDVGTTVTLWFRSLPGALTSTVARADAWSGSERVVLVDDDEAILRLMEQALRHKGYGVHAASRADEALALLDAHSDVDVLVADIVMPGMDGLTMVRQVLDRHARLKVLLVSGFTPDFDVRALPPRTAFLAKPFTARELAIALQELVRATRLA